MTFIEKMLSFQGRMGRQDFWICTLIMWAVQITLGIGIAVVMFTSIGMSGLANEGELSDAEALTLLSGMILPIGLALIVQLGLIWPDLAIKVKRFHDRDQSGWLAALFFLNWVPLINYLTFFPLLIFWLVDLGILEGTLGPNRYGQSPDPRYLSDTVFA